jgi:hypothetical protein
VRYISECIVASIELNPPRALAKVFRTARPLFYEWHRKDKEAKVLPPDVTSVMRSLHKRALLLRLDSLAGPTETKEFACIKKIKTKLANVSAFEFKHRYVSRNPSIFYLVILPEFCYCDEATVAVEQNMIKEIFRIGNRQNISWLNIEHEAHREFQLKFLFYGPDKEKFRMRQTGDVESLSLPQNSKNTFKEINDLVRLAVVQDDHTKGT